MIKRMKTGSYRLYSRKRNPKTGKRRNLGTFRTLATAKRHEAEVQFLNGTEMATREPGCGGGRRAVCSVCARS